MTITSSFGSRFINTQTANFPKPYKSNLNPNKFANDRNIKI